jgi:Lsr2
MAQKVQALLVDDLDGSDADGTVSFSVEGADYEIDLSASHARQLRDALAPYIGVARRGGNSGRAQTGRKTIQAAPDPTEVREWARTQGIDIKARGRVAANVIAKFKAATAVEISSPLSEQMTQQIDITVRPRLFPEGFDHHDAGIFLPGQAQGDVVVDLHP